MLLSTKLPCVTCIQYDRTFKELMHATGIFYYINTHKKTLSKASPVAHFDQIPPHIFGLWDPVSIPVSERPAHVFVAQETSKNATRSKSKWKDAAHVQGCSFALPPCRRVYSLCQVCQQDFLTSLFKRILQKWVKHVSTSCCRVGKRLKWSVKVNSSHTVQIQRHNVPGKSAWTQVSKWTD